MKDLYGFILIMLLVALMMIIFSMSITRQPEPAKVYPEPTTDVCGFASQIEYENFKRLHRFHGTLSSFDIDGNCVYMRGGQLCSLWDPLVRTDR